jgi:hypothetical protein
MRRARRLKRPTIAAWEPGEHVVVHLAREGTPALCGAQCSCEAVAWLAEYPVCEDCQAALPSRGIEVFRYLREEDGAVLLSFVAPAPEREYTRCNSPGGDA